MAPLGVWLWPARAPPAIDWLAVAALAIVCTACAYLLYYRLIARISATTLTGVAFVIPVFGVLWGALFLHEQVTAHIVTGMLVTLAGTAFTTGTAEPLAILVAGIELPGVFVRLRRPDRHPVP